MILSQQFNLSFSLPVEKGIYYEFSARSGYSRTPLIRINWDGEPSEYAENADNWIFLWKYVTLAVWSNNLQYVDVPTSKPFAHAWFEVLGAITLYR
jgi:hypothetical protein